MGSWSFIGDAKDVTNLEEAVKAQADTTNMSFHAGSPMLGSDIRLEGFWRGDGAVHHAGRGRSNAS